MPAELSLLYFDGGQNGPPGLLLEVFARARGLELAPVRSMEELLERTNRGFPACLVLNAKGNPSAVLDTCIQMKADPFTAIIPVALLVPDDSADLPTQGLESGADEVLREGASDREKVLRLDLLMRRAARDVSVHPTTRLPGTTQIERTWPSGSKGATSSPSATRILITSRSSTIGTDTSRETGSFCSSPRFSGMWFGRWHRADSSGTSAETTSSFQSP